MNKASTLWTETEIDTLKTMLADKKPYGEIANILGRSKSAVGTKTLSLGLRSAKKPGYPNRTAAKTVSTQTFRRPPEIYEGYGKPIKLMSELTERDCRWPIAYRDGQPTGLTWFCGAECESVYCETHRKVAYAEKKAG